ncbi:MAG TPA: hydroxyurea phosphotransferase [Micrococcales bacterium]|nr:hydroxyurea phosphotransferase [Micrococcales bacterium]
MAACGLRGGRVTGSPGLPASLPDGLARLVATPEGAAWLARVPHLLARAVERWDLELAPPFSAGSASWTALARPRGGRTWRWVLKITYPHPEAAREADGLMHWHGHGAPRLVDVEPDDWALLMEAVIPGTPLAASLWPTEQALRTGARTLAELHAVPLPERHAFEDLGATTRAWAQLVAQRAEAMPWAGADRDLVADTVTLLAELPATTTRRALLHGDFNPGNVLAAEDEHRTRWVAIDPKPVVGDPAFDPWPLLEQVGDPFAARDVPAELARRSAAVAPLLEVVAWRVAAWSLARRVESNLWLAATTPAEQREELELPRQWAEARAWRSTVALLDPSRA